MLIASIPLFTGVHSIFVLVFKIVFIFHIDKLQSRSKLDYKTYKVLYLLGLNQFILNHTKIKY